MTLDIVEEVMAEAVEHGPPLKDHLTPEQLLGIWATLYVTVVKQLPQPPSGGIDPDDLPVDLARALRVANVLVIARLAGVHECLWQKQARQTLAGMAPWVERLGMQGDLKRTLHR